MNAGCDRAVPLFAKVAVSDLPFAADRPYDYVIPEALRDRIRPGVRVWVPFAHGNRKTEGFVLKVSESSEYEKVKPISALIDEQPLLGESAVALALWMRSRYFCTCFEALRVMLPTGFWMARTEMVALLPGQDHEEALLLLARAPSALKLYQQLWENGGAQAKVTLREQLGESSLDAALKTLTQHGLVKKETLVRRQAKDKTLKQAALLISADEALMLAEEKRPRAPQQAALLTMLAQLGAVAERELCYFTGAKAASILALEKAGVLERFEIEAPLSPRVTETPSLSFSLSESQAQVVESLLTVERTQRPAVALITGVTGSGKTAVYIDQTRSVLADGGQAIVMVPEIVLTPQLMATFGAAFGEKVALLHSGLSIAERMDEWKRIRSGQVDVVLGTRSAVFAPLDRLKLIVMDEEQEPSYKSESAPRYHAREVAQYRLSKTGGLLVLGSATPSLESAYHAQTGRYLSLRLTQRFNTRPLPEVILADRREDLIDGNDSGIGRVLAEEMAKNLESGQQSILFLNRRGYNRYYVCESCGNSPGCPRCSVSLTYHSANRRLMCHYCGHSEPESKTCVRCGAPLHPIGSGTQRVEESLERLFPGVGVLRMDADTTSGRGAHEKQLSAFAAERIPILIGTQMVTRGLDFENVTLVGVLDADMALNISDFRAHERCFSLIAQVIGRAGRGRLPGRAVIQTFTPQEPVLLAAARQDYDSFFEQELALRQAAGLPPFSELLRLTFSGVFQDNVRETARRCRMALDNWRSGLNVLGPAPAPVLKMGGRYRYQITMLGEITAQTREWTAHLIRAQARDKRNAGVRIQADLNPYE